MIVRCTGNAVADLSADDRHYISEYVHLDEVGLCVGKEYLVFGVSLKANKPWFLVLEEDSDTYPKPEFASFFELIDGRVPPDWSLTLLSNNLGTVTLLPNEWVTDRSFLEKLVDDVPEALDRFRKLKARLLDWHAK